MAGGSKLALEDPKTDTFNAILPETILFASNWYQRGLVCLQVEDGLRVCF